MDSENDIYKMCRLCLAKEQVDVHIFEEKSDEEQIFLKISSCLPIKISYDDRFPKKICLDCSCKLDAMYEFWNKSINSESQLLTWLGPNSVENVSTDDNSLNLHSEIYVKEEAIDVLKTENDIKVEVMEESYDEESYNQRINEFSDQESSHSKRKREDSLGYHVNSNDDPLLQEKDSKIPSRRPPKNKQKSKRKLNKYSEEALATALLVVREGRKSIRKASKEYGVPKTTIQDRLKGRVADKIGKTGPEPILTIDGEKRIADWVATMAKCGFTIQKKNLMETVQKIVKDSDKKNILKNTKIFKNGKPGQKWYTNFLRRHPEIAIREAESVNKARAVATEENIRLWFFELQKFLEENDLMDIFDDPDRVLNGDECGSSLCPKTGQVFALKGWRSLYTVKVSSKKDHITVLVVFTASGKICPPLVVFPYMIPPKAVVESMPESWVLGKSESGCMKENVFYEYIANNFNNWLTENFIKKPVILFINGHRSHNMTLPLSEVCKKNGIILYALPPSSTQMLQPANVSVLRPLKQEWKNTVQNWRSKPENTNSLVTKTNFCKLFKEALTDSDMTNAIKNGFQKCGLFPLDPNNIDYKNCNQNTLEEQSNQCTDQE